MKNKTVGIKELLVPQKKFIIADKKNKETDNM